MQIISGRVRALNKVPAGGGHTGGINKNNRAPVVVKTVIIGIVPGPGFLYEPAPALFDQLCSGHADRGAACCLLVGLAPTG